MMMMIIFIKKKYKNEGPKGTKVANDQRVMYSTIHYLPEMGCSP